MQLFVKRLGGGSHVPQPFRRQDDTEKVPAQVVYFYDLPAVPRVVDAYEYAFFLTGPEPSI
jgi:hypothetical protein